MKKQLTEKIVYEPNRLVKVTVTNKPEFDEDSSIVRYKREVTIKISAGTSTDKLTFGSDDDIAKYIETVDFEDPQLDLLEDGAESEE